MDKVLTGESLPTFNDLAAALLWTAAVVRDEHRELAPQNDDGLFYQTEDADYYMLYKPDIEWLQSKKANLHEERAKRIHDTGKKAVVFAADKYMSQRFLTDLDISFCQLPYELFIKA